MSQLGFVGVITIMAVGLVADAIDAVPIDLGPYLNAGAVTVLSALLWIIITKLWPKERREAEAARAGGMLTSYTVHSGVMPILDYLASLTVDSLFGIDIAFEGVDLSAIKRKLGGRKCLWIGPSSTYHLWNGPEATREAVRTVFDVFGRRGVILVPCVSAHSIMPWESTLAMIDEWKKLRRP